ncbi:MAG: spore coat protein CotJB [Clostridia bacterium]|nr:spore coat protein CotJB [Clostridia bacterium]
MENNCGKALLNKLRMIDFSIYETVLFLDAYPEDNEALAYYHKLLEQRKALMSEYETKVGPLTIYGNTCGNEWKWIKQPWPWEYDAN